MASGRFITFEGGEGAGKTTQINLLCDVLTPLTEELLLTREPGGSPGAEQIRQLLVTGAAARWTPMTEILLHFAARREHLERTVWPALDRGAWVLCDRFADSTLAYQGYGHGQSIDEIVKIYNVAVGTFSPDFTAVLDVPVGVGLKRAAGRDHDENRYESMDREFHERVREGFKTIAAKEPGRCQVFDATSDPETLQAEIRSAISARLGVKLS